MATVQTMGKARAQGLWVWATFSVTKAARGGPREWLCHPLAAEQRGNSAGGGVGFGQIFCTATKQWEGQSARWARILTVCACSIQKNSKNGFPCVCILGATLSACPRPTQNFQAVRSASVNKSMPMAGVAPRRVANGKYISLSLSRALSPTFDLAVASLVVFPLPGTQAAARDRTMLGTRSWPPEQERARGACVGNGGEKPKTVCVCVCVCE
jgi:hypothetical protein